MTQDHQTRPTYGVLDHYLGERGRVYFARQSESGVASGAYNKHIWQPYVSPRDEVLDFGCGGGFLLSVLDARRKVGVEINPHARAVAQHLGIETHEVIEQVTGKFDRVISSHALEHVPHPGQVLLELRDRLRDERSQLLLLLPLDDWRSRANRRYDASNVHKHLYTWTPQLLGNLLHSSGLQVIEIRVLNHAWPPGKDVLWKLSPALFHAAAYCWSVVNKQRQILAVAGP